MDDADECVRITPQAYRMDPDCKAMADRLMSDNRLDPKTVLEIRVGTYTIEVDVITGWAKGKGPRWRTKVYPR